MSDSYRKDEYKKVRIPFGFNEQLQKVFLSLFHTFFVAMTGHGKTLGMKSLLFRFHKLFPDWKILIIDSKDKRDYSDLNADIPICFVETTDPLDLKNLMEPIIGSKMMYFFDKIIEEAVFDTLGEIHRSIAQKVEDADAHRIRISGKDLGKLRVLNYTLGKLVALVEKPNIINELKLHDGFNVMPIALPDVKNPNLKRAFQQLITRSVLILLLSDPSLEKTLLVLDEVHKWSPQKWASICKQPLSEFVSEGRSQDKMLWESDQALTKVDKEPLKNIKIWVVGQQMESNEVQDAMDTVNDITDLNVSESEIKNLKMGNFILVDGLHGTVEKAYLQPYNLPDDIAQQIAQGANPEIAEPCILEFESKLRKSMEVDTDLVYKEEVEKLRGEKAELTEKVSGLEESKKTLLGKVEELSEQLKTLEAFRTAMKNLFGPAIMNDQLQKDVERIKTWEEPIANLNNMVRQLQDDIKKIETMPHVESGTSLSIAEIDERINQRVVTLEPEKFVSVDVDARIKELVKNEVISRLVTKIQQLTEPAKRAAWWLHERKHANIKELYNFVYGGQTEFTGRAVGLFSANVVTPLADAWLIVKENGNIRWVLQEKLVDELKTVLTNEDIEKVPKYLASLLL
jgi:hypothetical protein